MKCTFFKFNEMLLFCHKELVGVVGGKLHTGRSRNDQVATDMRLWLGDAVLSLRGHLVSLLSVMCRRAEA